MGMQRGWGCSGDVLRDAPGTVGMHRGDAPEPGGVHGGRSRHVMDAAAPAAGSSRRTGDARGTRRRRRGRGRAAGDAPRAMQRGPRGQQGMHWDTHTHTHTHTGLWGLWGRGAARQPRAHLWALLASPRPSRGRPAGPAAWRPGWTRRGCSPLPKPFGRRPTGCLRTRETRLGVGGTRVRRGTQRPGAARAPAPRQPGQWVSAARRRLPAAASSPSCGAAGRHPWVLRAPRARPGCPHTAAAPIPAAADAGPARTRPWRSLSSPQAPRCARSPPTAGGHSPTWPLRPHRQGPEHGLVHPSLPHGHCITSPGTALPCPHLSPGYSLPHRAAPAIQGARPPQGARGWVLARPSVPRLRPRAPSPVRGGVGEGCGAWPLGGLRARGAPSYLHGKKEERFGVRWQEI